MSVIDVRAFSHHYGPIQAVDGVTFQVEPGEMFGLVGPDGAGKTTMVRAIAGLIQPAGGTVRLWDTGWEQDRVGLKARIGYLSQRFSLYGDLTVSENVDFFAAVFGVEDYRQRKAELLEWTGLAPFTGRLADRLSGGMKQKLALVCSLIHTPDLLLLDEPTAGVDPVSRREFWRILSELRRSGLTLLVTTPYLDEAERCTRVGFMDGGRLLRCDNPARVRAEAGRRVVEIMTDAPRDAAAYLRTRPDVSHLGLFGARVAFEYPPDQNIDALVEALRGRAIPVTGARRVMPSLEHLFIGMMTDRGQESGVRGQ
ncbi:MAG: ABC transporter ATP-binding protein [Candidatus Latescibacteria bacterium]|nr:ABC transporter ATP-binding protein [Candidatus Latescibacterota bacterium]